MSEAPVSKDRIFQGGTLAPQRRQCEFIRQAINEDARTVELVFSSETPVERFFGDEVLSHQKSAVRMTRINTAAPLLVNHDTNDQIGVVDHATVKNGQGRATVRFGSSARAEEIFNDVKDGIRQLVSVGYAIHEVEVEEREDQADLVRAVDWEPHEISIVATPADLAAGVGRDDTAQKNLVVVRSRTGSRAAAGAEVQETKTEKQTIEIMEKETAAPVDTEAIKREAVKEHAEQIAKFDREADALTNQNNQIPADVVRELVTKHRATGDIAALKSDYIAELGNPVHIERAKPAPLEISDRELEGYDFGKLIRSQLTRDSQLDGLELELHNECVKRSAGAIHPEGYMMPFRVAAYLKKRNLEQRVMGATTGVGLGAEAVPTLVDDDIIEYWRSKVVTMALGARVLSGLTGNIQLPRHATVDDSSWATEVEAIAANDPNLDTVTLTPHRVGNVTEYSKQLVIQSAPDIAAFLRQDQADDIAVKIDQAALHGGGATDPQGIIGTTGVGTFAFGTGPVTIGKFGEALGLIEDANAPFGASKYFVGTGASYYHAATTPREAGDARMVLDAPAYSSLSPLSVLDAGYVSTSSMGAAAGASEGFVIGGIWSELILGFFGDGLDVVVDPYTAAEKAQIRVTTNAFMDVGVRHPGAFVNSTDKGDGTNV